MKKLFLSLFTALTLILAPIAGADIPTPVKAEARGSVLQLVEQDPSDGKWLGMCSAVKLSPHFLLTAAHCMSKVTGSDPNDEFWAPVWFKEPWEGIIAQGEVAKVDVAKDLALIRVHTVCPCASLAGIQPSRDDEVMAIGYPMPDDTNNVQFLTEGTFQGNYDNEFSFVTSQVIFGNSGGGIFNKYGHLIGITSALVGVPDIAWHPIYHMTLISRWSSIREFLDGF